MTFLPRMLSVILSISALPATADVTPEDVWSAFRAQVESYGKVSADEERRGDWLTISNLTMVTTAEDVTSTIEMEQPIIFRALGDGSVAIDFPSELSTRVTVNADDPDPIDATYLVTQEGMQVTATGTPEDILHNFSVDRMTYQISNLPTASGETDGAFDVTMSDLAGMWRSKQGAAQQLDAQYTGGALNLKGTFADKAQDVDVAFDVQLNDLELASRYELPPGLALLTPAQIFGSGFTAVSDMAYAGGAFAMSTTTKGTTTRVEGTMGAGTFDVSFDEGVARYATTSNAFKGAGSLVGLPFPPVDIGFDQSRFDLMVPLAQSDDAQDFGMEVALEGLTVSDFLWSMIDPTGSLPRDAADLVIDIEGTGNWLVDITDPEAIEAADAGRPGEIESASVKTLRLKIAGAELTGTGDFTFDNADLETFGGIPRPIGKLDLAMTGGITLLDKLAAIGIVPQEQAVGIKMMSGLFAKPGAGPDSLTSTIEFDANGRLLANGVPLQ